MNTLLVADSFRVRECDGVAEARMPGLHLERFSAGVAETLLAMGEEGPGTDWWELEFLPFLDTLPEQLALGGAGFPRIELRVTDDGALSLAVQIRRLPRLTTRIDLRTAPEPDRVAPRIKGPDIDRLLAMNRESGAETLLLDGTGDAIEGATTSLLWWDSDTLCVSAATQRISSVTEELVRAIAEQRGVRVETRNATPADLRASEVWAVNALHGIRAVTHIDDIETARARRGRLADYRDALEDTWQPLLGDVPKTPLDWS